MVVEEINKTHAIDLAQDVRLDWDLAERHMEQVSDVGDPRFISTRLIELSGTQMIVSPSLLLDWLMTVVAVLSTSLNMKT